jgi:hypothetical protein
MFTKIASKRCLFASTQEQNSPTLIEAHIGLSIMARKSVWFEMSLKMVCYYVGSAGMKKGRAEAGWLLP